MPLVQTCGIRLLLLCSTRRCCIAPGRHIGRAAKQSGEDGVGLHTAAPAGSCLECKQDAQMGAYAAACSAFALLLHMPLPLHVYHLLGTSRLVALRTTALAADHHNIARLGHHLWMHQSVVPFAGIACPPFSVCTCLTSRIKQYSPSARPCQQSRPGPKDLHIEQEPSMAWPHGSHKDCPGEALHLHCGQRPAQNPTQSRRLSAQPITAALSGPVSLRISCTAEAWT